MGLWFFLVGTVVATYYFVKQMPYCFHYDLEYNFYNYCDPASNKQDCYNKFAILVKKMADAHHKRGHCFSIDANVFMGTKICHYGEHTYNLMEFVLGVCDRVALMDYNNDVNKIISQAEDEIAYYDKCGKHLDIGVHLGSPPSVESFYGLGQAALENALTQTHNAYQVNTSFDMMAIHYLKPWNASLPSTIETVDRAVWSWSLGESILTDDDPDEVTQRQELLDFMSNHRVKRIYVAAETSLIYRPEGLAAFLNDTFDLGITVDLEIGDSTNPAKGKEWLFYPDRAVIFANQMMDVIDLFKSDDQNTPYSKPNHCITIIEPDEISSGFVLVINVLLCVFLVFVFN